MANIWKALAVAGAAGVLTAGCLLKTTVHTWYLEPATGEVTWTVLEQDVRSDAKTAEDRHAEESAYWADVQAGTHVPARAFRELNAANLRTRVLRSRVPFSVVTDATFTTIDELGRRLIPLSGLSGSSVLERDGDSLQWTMAVRDPHAEEPSASEAVSGLLADLDTLRVVLVSGQFESGVGFTLESDRRVARFVDPSGEAGDDPLIMLRLRWKVALTR